MGEPQAAGTAASTTSTTTSATTSATTTTTSSAETPAIAIEHLRKAFGTFVAVEDLSLSVAPGEIFGMLGPNGSGKTTTVNLISGLAQPTSGRVTIFGRDYGVLWPAAPEPRRGAGARERPARPRYRHDIGLVQFDLVPTLVLLLTIAGIENSGLATAREWEDQTIKELLLAPVPRSSLIAGKILAGWITALLVGLIVLGIAAGVGLLRPQGIYWLTTLVTIALIALASVGLGVTFGALFRRFTVVSGVGIIASFYPFFLSGGISVAAFLPGWVQTIARFIPTYYGAHALQMAIFHSSSDQLGRDLLVLAATAALTLLVEVYMLNRRAAV